MTSPITCLGFTSSTEHGSIALAYKNKIIKIASWTRKEQASEALTLKIKSGLKKLKISFQDLNLIAVDKGPGSFTGSRISVNVAKTLAYSLNIPIYAGTSLDILAFGFAKKLKINTPATVFTLVDAHKALFYFQEYDLPQVGELAFGKKIQALSLEEISSKATPIGDLFLIGNIQTKAFNILKEQIQNLHPKLKIKMPTKIESHFPQASSLVEMAIGSAEKERSTWQEVEPSYVRAPDAVEKLQSQ